MGSHDTGIHLNTNSTESNGVHRRHRKVELLSADIISPVSQSSEISTQRDDNAPDNDEVFQDVRKRASFEKTSTWLLQQDTNRAFTTEESNIGLERATQSNIYVGSKCSDVDATSTISASRSEPALSQNVILSENGIGMARSSVTVVASASSEQAFADCHSSSCISTPASHHSSRQKTRQLRFSCAVAAVEDLPDIKDSDVDVSHTFPSKNAASVAEEADGQQFVAYSTRNDVEELSVEDAASLANSNTSLSDTCNSSFKSSTEDLANHAVSCVHENGASNAAEVTARVSSPRSQHSPGLRHRKRRIVNDSQQIYNLSPARQCEHVRLAEEGTEDIGGSKICQECDSPVVASGADAAAAAAVNELPRVTVSSDDDDDNDNKLAPHISPSKCRLHPRHARRPCSVRGMRSNDKFSCHNATADTLPKDRGICVDGRRSTVRIMDVRLLESTGISSADSDGEAAKLSATKLASTPKASNIVLFCFFASIRKLLFTFIFFL